RLELAGGRGAAGHHRRRLRPGGAGRGGDRSLPAALRRDDRGNPGHPGKRDIQTAPRPRRLTRSAMAVYTEVSDQELEEFLAGYDLGAPLSCKGIAEGVENSNFMLSTERGT